MTILGVATGMLWWGKRLACSADNRDGCPTTPAMMVRRFQTYLSCQTVTNLRIFRTTKEKGAERQPIAVLANRSELSGQGLAARHSLTFESEPPTPKPHHAN